MDCLSQLYTVYLQDPLPKPLDLSKRIPNPQDPLKKLPSRREEGALGSAGVCSPRSEFRYESEPVPLSASPANGVAFEPTQTVISSLGTIRTDSMSVKEAQRRRRPTGEGTREESSVGLQDVPSRLSFVSWACVTRGSPNDCVSRRAEKNDQIEWKDDSESLESTNVVSTTDTENAAVFKAAQVGSGGASSSSSVTSPSLNLAPAARKTKPRQCRRSPAGKKETANAAKRRKKKSSGLSASSAVAFNGPEIRLKYAQCKEEKRESQGNAFAPYVRVAFSGCTVVNFEEDGDVRRPALYHGVVPTTSCFRLRRLGSERRHQTGDLCCLCGRTANAAGLGDLHGPYHPCRPDWKMSINGIQDAGANTTRSPDEGGECWVHEDCCVWSGGVFLVRGRLYGLDEAVRLAREAVCCCCHRRGATLGCTSRGCLSKYHFPCALQSECLFNEENFTLRCPKHKERL